MLRWLGFDGMNKLLACDQLQNIGDLAPNLIDLVKQLAFFSILLRREGEPSGVNRIHRLYREEPCVNGARDARLWEPALRAHDQFAHDTKWLR